MRRLLATSVLIVSCALSISGQQNFSALHSHQDQEQVIEAVVRYELRYELTRSKGTVFLRVFRADPSRQLVQALGDLPLRIIPASRAEPEAAGTTATMIPRSYKDRVSGKEGLLLDVRYVVWPKEGCVNILAGFDGSPRAFRMAGESNQWEVHPSALKGIRTFEGFSPEPSSLALSVTCAEN